MSSKYIIFIQLEYLPSKRGVAIWILQGAPKKKKYFIIKNRINSWLLCFGNKCCSLKKLIV